MAEPAQSLTRDETLENDIENDQDNVVPISNNFPESYQNLPPEQMQELVRQEQARKQQEIAQSINEKLQTQQALSDEELDFVKRTSPEQFKPLLINNKMIKGEKLTEAEKRFQRHQHELQGDTNLAQFHQLTDQLVAKGGKKVVHFTDPHLKYEDLETRIGEVLDFQNFNPEEDLFVNTGDILPDLIDMKNDGLNALNPNRIAHEAGFDENKTKEFVDKFEDFLQYAGMNVQDIEAGGATLGPGGEQLLQKFQQYLYLMGEPDHLTVEELEQFRETREEVHDYLADAIHSHARIGYQKIKDMFNKYGITSENSILLVGNHDVEEEMREVLGDYIPNAGEVVERQGFKIGNLISGSTGESMGFHMSKEFGWQDVRKDPRTWYDSENFQKLKEHIHDSGLTHIDDFRLKSMIEHAKYKQSLGIADSALAKFFAEKIKPDIDHTVKKAISKVPKINPKDVDFFVGHGNPVHPNFAGAEEGQVHDYIKDSGKPYLYGHVHGNDSQKFDDVFYLNPGTAENYGHGAYAFNSEKDLEYIAFAQANPLTRKIDYRLLTPESLSSEDKKYGSLGG